MGERNNIKIKNSINIFRTSRPVNMQKYGTSIRGGERAFL